VENEEQSKGKEKKGKEREGIHRAMMTVDRTGDRTRQERGYFPHVRT
jgi:hypothetical protein